MTDKSLDELLEEDDDDFDVMGRSIHGRLPSMNTVGSDAFDELFDDDDEESDVIGGYAEDRAASSNSSKPQNVSFRQGLPPPSYDSIEKLESPTLKEKAILIENLKEDKTEPISNTFESISSNSINVKEPISETIPSTPTNVKNTKEEKISNIFESCPVPSIDVKDSERKNISSPFDPLAVLLNADEKDRNKEKKKEDEIETEQISNPFEPRPTPLLSEVEAEEENSIDDEENSKDEEEDDKKQEEEDNKQKNIQDAEHATTRKTTTPINKRKKWKCPRCTMRNALSLTKCAVCNLSRPDHHDTSNFASKKKTLSAVEILFENVKRDQRNLYNNKVEEPLDLLHVESAGQDGLAEDILRFEDTNLKNDCMTSIVLDTKWIVTGTKNGDAILYDHYHVERARFEAPKHAKGEAITALAISPKSETLLCGHKNGSLVLWNLTSRKMLHRLASPRSGSSAIQDIVFLSSMRALVLNVSCVATFVQYRTKLLGSGYNVQTSIFSMPNEKDTASIAALDYSTVLALTIHGSRNMTTLIVPSSTTQIPSSESQCLGSVALHQPDPKWPVLRIIVKFSPNGTHLAQAYGNTLQLVERRRKEGKKENGGKETKYVDYMTQKFQDSITEIQWLENDLLVLLTASGKLHAYSCSKRSVLISTSLSSDDNEKRSFIDYVASSSSSKAYYSERMSSRCIRAIHLRTATERLSMLIGSNRWIPALASGLEMCTGPKDVAQAQGLLQSFLHNNILAGSSNNTVSNTIAARVAAHFSQRCADAMSLLEMTALHCVETDKKISNEDDKASPAFASAVTRLLWHQRLSSPSAALLDFLFRFSPSLNRLEMALMRCDWTQKAAETALPTLMAGPVISSLLHVATRVMNPPQYGAAVTALLKNAKIMDSTTTTTFNVDGVRMLLLYVKCCLCGTQFPYDDRNLNSMDEHHARITVCAALFQEKSYLTLRRLLSLEASMMLYALEKFVECSRNRKKKRADGGDDDDSDGGDGSSSDTNQVVGVLLEIASDTTGIVFDHVCVFFAKIAKKYEIRPLLPPDILIGVLSAFTARAVHVGRHKSKVVTRGRRMSLDLEPDELESEVLRLISSFESSVKRWGRPSHERLHRAVVEMASAGLSWPAAGLAAKFGTTREVLHAFLSQPSKTNTTENGMSRAAFVYLNEQIKKCESFENAKILYESVMEWLPQLVRIDAPATADLIREITHVQGSTRQPVLPTAFLQLLAQSKNLRRDMIIMIRSFDFVIESEDSCVSLCSKYHVPEVEAELYWRKGDFESADQTLIHEFEKALKRMFDETFEEAKECADAVLLLTKLFVERYCEASKTVTRAENLWCALLQCNLAQLSVRDHESRVAMALRSLAETLLSECRNSMPLPSLLNRVLSSSSVSRLPLAEMRELICGVLRSLFIEQQLLRSVRRSADASCVKGRLFTLPSETSCVQGQRITDTSSCRASNSSWERTADELDGLFFRVNRNRLPNRMSQLQFVPPASRVVDRNGPRKGPIPIKPIRVVRAKFPSF